MPNPGDDEAAIVCVPPYHVASVSSVLSTTYTGRRVVPAVTGRGAGPD